ncbi:hypothetical protein KCU61_g7213, partial [Aureobasidium melanogenum]
MATPHQLFHLRDLLRSLKYMFAFASFVALAGIVFLTTVHSRVTTAVLIGMCDPRLHFLYAGGVRVGRARRSRGVSGAGTLPEDIDLAAVPRAYSSPGNVLVRPEETLPARSGTSLMYTMERLGRY